MLNFLLMIQRWWQDSFLLFLFPPDLTSQVSKYAGVLVEIVPCEVFDVVRESKHPCGDSGNATDNSSIFQSRCDSVVDVKILSAGLPIYVPFEGRLLIAGKLVKPVPVICQSTSLSIPPTYCSP